MARPFAGNRLWACFFLLSVYNPRLCLLEHGVEESDA